MTKNDILDMISEIRYLIDNGSDIKFAVKDRLKESINSYEDSLSRSMDYLLTKSSLTIIKKLNTIEKEMAKGGKDS